MMESDDLQLLREFAESQSETAFAELVQRHVNLVYSAALRQTADPQAAEEISQAVFIILARKARSLGRKTVLAGWLYQTARWTAANYLRTERRRVAREQEAYMQSLANQSAPDVWPQIVPLLEDAMSKLGEKDRNAIVLRFFEGKSLHEVGIAIAASEDAAKMRVNRAVEKLRKFLAKRGVVLSASALGAALAANSAVATPQNLATNIAAGAVKGAALSGSIFALVTGTLKLIAWAKAKSALGIVAGMALAIAVATIATLSLDQRKPATTPRANNSPNETRSTPSVARTWPIRDPFTSTVHMTLGVAPGAVALQPDGKIVIGTTLSGFFIDENTGVIGSYRRAAMRIQPDGTLDRTFLCEVNDVNASDAMRSHIEVLGDGRMLVNGLFKRMNDVPRSGYAMIQPDGQTDESFDPFSGVTNSWNGYFRQTATRAAALLGDGSVEVMNGSIEKTNQTHVLTAYRLDGTGRVLPPAQRDLAAAEFGDPSGMASALGELGFWTRRPIDWSTETRAGIRPAYLASLPSNDYPFERWTNTPTAGDASAALRVLFSEVPIELCRYAVRLPDGGAVLAVRTEFVDGSRVGRGTLMRFDKNWRPDLSFTNHYEADSGSCITVKRQKDGKLLVAGIAGTFNGEEFPGLLRLNTDGSVDPTFRCVTSERSSNDPTLDQLRRRIIDMAIQDDGKILIAGFFIKVSGVERHHLARLNPDGSLDETFRTPFTTWEGLKQYRRVRVESLTSKASPRPAKTDSKGGATAASPNDAPVAQTVLITLLRMDNSAAVIQFTGSPRQIYILQAGDSLDTTTWTNLSTNKANAAGNGLFRDDSVKNHPMRFYRIATP